MNHEIASDPVADLRNSQHPQSEFLGPAAQPWVPEDPALSGRYNR
jgi:hypothetical protein